MRKTIRNISINLDVWNRAIAEGKRVRTSASWVCEEALRRYLKIDGTTSKERRRRGPNRKLESTASQGA